MHQSGLLAHLAGTKHDDNGVSRVHQQGSPTQSGVSAYAEHCVSNRPLVAKGFCAMNHEGSSHLSGTNLERAGDHNQRVTLHAIRVNGPITRSDLRSMTGLTAAAITNITDRLLKQRLILKAGRTRGTRGQPATKLVINPDG